MWEYLKILNFSYMVNPHKWTSIFPASLLYQIVFVYELRLRCVRMLSHLDVIA